MAKRLVPATHFPAPTPEPEAPAATEAPAVEAAPEVAEQPAAAEVEETAPAESQASESPATIEVAGDETCASSEPVIVHDAAAQEANAPFIQQGLDLASRQNHPGAVVLKFGIPMKQSTGYAPQSIVLTLTPKLARTLADFGEGLRSMGIRIDHPQDAIKRLLEALHEGGPNRLFFAEAGE